MTTRIVMSLAGMLLLLVLAGTPLPGQGTILDQYIEEAWKNNLPLQEKQLQTEKLRLNLQEAKTLYGPSVTAGVNYTLAAGGRSIAFPIGDIMNPVYNTLNELIQENRFGQLENVKEQFLPNNFYDAKVRVSQPILNQDIKYNDLIRQEQVKLQNVDNLALKRVLSKEVKVAYFQYIQAQEALKIYESSRHLILESKRTNESMVKNGVALPGVLVRIDGELSKLDAAIVEAQNQANNAQTYFNHLLRKPYNTPVLADSVFFGLPPEQAILQTAGQREELQQLEVAQKINQLVVEQQEKFKSPKIGAQLDLGSQGFNFDWGAYALLGFSLEIPLYSGKRNLLKIDQAKIDLQILERRKEQVKEQIDLQVQLSRNTLSSQLRAFQSYDDQIHSAKRFYNDTNRRYKEGQAPYIEVIDAYTQLNNAGIQQSIARFNIWRQWAELEFAIAGLKIE